MPLKAVRHCEQRWSLFDDVVECLDGLGMHQLGVVSNGNSQQQRAKLARMGILERFSHVVVSEDVGVAKPDGLIFARACELTGVASTSAIYIGDNLETDALGAHRAGLHSIWLNRCRSRSTPGAELRTIRGLSELPRIVQELSRAEQAV